MSWRTRGQYQGLSRRDAEWLKRFDREWDTKAQGRSRTDALEAEGPHALFSERSAPPNRPGVEQGAKTRLEADLLTAVRIVERFTVPKQTKSGWSIHVVLKCGKRTRVRFDDFDSARHAYEELAELSQWFYAG